MISNLPDWVGAGAAVTAVLGGLAGVYATSQSRSDVQDNRIETIVMTLETLTEVQGSLETRQRDLEGKMIRSEVSAEYLQEGQARLSKSVDTLAGEVRQLSQAVLAKHSD